MVSRGHRDLLVATSVVTCLLVALGGIVCATRASGGCPDWPRCQGRLLPPLQVSPILEYTHRVVSLLTEALIVAAAIMGWRRPGSARALRVLPTIAVALTIVVAIFGAFAVLTGLPPLLAAADLGTALIVLALVVAAAVIGSICHERRALAVRPSSRNRLAVLSGSATGTLFAVFLLGVFVAQGSAMRCLGGPLHTGHWTSIAEAMPWQSGLRQLLAAITAVLVIAAVATAVRGRYVDPPTRRWAIGVLILFVLEAALLVAMAVVDAEVPLLIASAIVAAGMWSALVAVTVRARYSDAAAGRRPVAGS